MWTHRHVEGPEKLKATRLGGLKSLNSKWCPGSDSNRHDYSSADFESAASTDFATRATARDYTNGAMPCKVFFSCAHSFAHLFNALPMRGQLHRMPASY
jgi:hypothetical protein